MYHFASKSAPNIHAKTLYEEEEDELITYKFLKQHVGFKFSDTYSVSSRQLQVRNPVHYAVARWIFTQSSYNGEQTPKVEDHPSWLLFVISAFSMTLNFSSSDLQTHY